MSKENIYSIATASILDKSTIRQALTWFIEDHVKKARASGYNGIELWPQAVKPLFQIRTGKINKMEIDGTTSVHQSVNVSLGKAVRSHSLREIAQTVAFPGSIKSLDDLERIRILMDKNIPVVLLNNVPESFIKTTKYSQKGIQPKPEFCSEIGATNAEEFVEAVLKMGFTNVVVDTHHLRRPNIETRERNPLADWRKSIPVLLPYANEIHLGLGRSDYGGLKKMDINNELWDFMNNGKNDTEVIQMLRSIAKTGWRGLVVLELRPLAVKEVLNQKGIQLSEKNLLDSFERIRNTLHQVFDK